MFDKNYKNAMDNISPSDDVKEKVLDSIVLKEEVARHKNPAIPWRIAFACVTCVAIVLTVLFIPKKDKTIAKSSSAEVITATQSYDDVYTLLSDKKIMAKYYGYGDVEYYYDGMLVIEESASADGAMPGTADGDMGGDKTYNTGSESLKKDDFSGTTEQVEGVAEADVIKTDGKYIYYLNRDYANQKVSIFSADKENSRFLAQIDLSQDEVNCEEMFLKDDRLIILQTSYDTGLYAKMADMAYMSGNVSITIYDVSDPSSPQKVATVCQEGYYNSARMIGDKIYLISNCDINLNDIDKEDPTTFVPTTVVNGEMKPVPADRIYCYGDDLIEMPQYAVIGAYSFNDGTMIDTASILGGTHQIYCSQNNIILTKSRYYGINESQNGSTSSTVISRLQIDNGQIEFKSSGEINGILEDQFFIDEYNGYFRFVTTVSKVQEETVRFDNTTEEIIEYSTQDSASLTILDGELKKVGEIADLAPDERVYSVRFMGDTAYFVTFRQIDPLFSADLSDPKNPKIIGELKIPGFSEYMYPYGDGQLLGFGQDADETTGRAGELKLSMFNISDPANVTEDDVTVIGGYSYSEALYNHKEMLVSPSKNLIGFSAHDSHGNADYLLYKYTGNEFVKLASLRVSEDYEHFGARGLFINDVFYTLNGDCLNVYDLETFTLLNSVSF